MWAIIKKEFKSYFYTPIGYVFIGVFLLAFSVSFYLGVIQSGVVNFEYIFAMMPSIVALGIIIPLLTMRTFSEERKTGTEQLLLTSPVSSWKIVLGKFLACMLIIVITEIFTLMYFAILCHYGIPKVKITISTLIGFLLFTMTYVSFGVLASSLTENQIIAGVITMIFFLVTWLLPNFSTKLTFLSFMNLFYKFVDGQIDIGSVITYLSFTVACLLLTMIVLQRRKYSK